MTWLGTSRITKIFRETLEESVVSVKIDGIHFLVDPTKSTIKRFTKQKASRPSASDFLSTEEKISYCHSP